MTTSLCWLSVKELRAGFRRQTFSPVHVAREMLDRIRDMNPVLNAYCYLDEDTTLAMAEASAARWRVGAPAGPLDGIPVSIKDLSYTREWPTRRGSHAISGQDSLHLEASAVSRLRRAGAVFMGKTSVPELGAKPVTHCALTGITRNPLDPALTPGGSSGGAAVSVAAGMATLALASDAAGSVRIPAAFTGCFGLKPSYGLVPDRPTSYLGPLAVIGPIARSVDDVHELMRVIARSALVPVGDEGDESTPHPTTAWRADGRPVAICNGVAYSEVDREIVNAFEDFVDLMRDQSIDVVRVREPFVFPADALDVLMSHGIARAFRVLGIQPDAYPQMEERLLELKARGEAVTDRELEQAKQARREFITLQQRFHSRHALLLTPAVSVLPFPAGLDAPAGRTYSNSGGWRPMLPPVNLSLQPAAALTVDVSASGLPIAVQVVGGMRSDWELLAFSRHFEALVAHRFPAPWRSPHVSDAPGSLVNP